MASRHENTYEVISGFAAPHASHRQADKRARTGVVDQPISPSNRWLIAGNQQTSEHTMRPLALISISKNNGSAFSTPKYRTGHRPFFHSAVIICPGN